MRDQQGRSKFRLLVLFLVMIVGVFGSFIWNWYFVTDPLQLYLSALDAVEIKQLDEARQKADQLQEIDGFHDHARLIRAACQLKEENPIEALRSLEQPFKDHQLRNASVIIRGNSHYKLGQLSKARILFEDYLQKYPDNLESLRWLAAIYYDLGAADHAVYYLEKLAAFEPENYATYRLLSIIHSDFDNFHDAISACQSALEKSPPENVENELRLRLIDNLKKMNQYEKALLEIKKLPESAKSLALAAEVQIAFGNQDAAWELWQKAVGLSPEEITVDFIGAQLLIERGEYRNAINRLTRVLNFRPHFNEARILLVQTWRLLGEFEKSELEMVKHQQSSSLKSKLNELNQRAIEELENAELRDEIAVLCEQLGKPELAESWRKAAAAIRLDIDKKPPLESR